MKYALSLLLVVVLAKPGLAQCGCRDLHLAMSDSRSYQYRYYRAGKPDTMAVQAARSAWPPGITRFTRSYTRLSLPQLSSGYQVEVTDSLTHQRMWLTFSYPPVDALSKGLLLEFAAGRHYHLPLEGALPDFEVTILEQTDAQGTQWRKLHKN